MKKSQRGFTLIELVTVIVILGILSAVAIPKYIDYRESAGLAAVKGVAASLASAATINYAASVARLPNATSVKSCDGVASLLAGGGLPKNFAFVSNVGISGPGASTTAPADISTTKTIEAVQADTGLGVTGADAYVANTTMGNTDSIGSITKSNIYTCTVKSSTDDFKAQATFSYTPTTI